MPHELSPHHRRETAYSFITSVSIRRLFGLAWTSRRQDKRSVSGKKEGALIILSGSQEDGSQWSGGSTAAEVAEV